MGPAPIGGTHPIERSGEIGPDLVQSTTKGEFDRFGGGAVDAYSRPPLFVHAGDYASPGEFFFVHSLSLLASRALRR